MGCEQCKRRQRLLIPCTLCKKNLCTNCLHLEVHSCPQIELKKQLERKKLNHANPVVITSKLEKI